MFKGEWLDWDDDIYVTNNPMIQSSPSPASINIFKTNFLGGYTPFTFAFLCNRLSILAARIQRNIMATNLLLHLFNTILGLFIILSL